MVQTNVVQRSIAHFKYNVICHLYINKTGQKYMLAHVKQIS